MKRKGGDTISKNNLFDQDLKNNKSNKNNETFCIINVEMSECML